MGAQDDLKRLKARSSAASLLLSASCAAAAMMLLLAEADVADLSGCSLLDAIICECANSDYQSQYH